MTINNTEKRKEYRKQYYLKNKQKIIKSVSKRKKEIITWFSEYKKQFNCSFCKESNPICIDFHHLDPSAKRDSIANLVNDGFSKETIKKEIDTCLALCSNCHRLLHYEQDLMKTIYS